MKILALVVGVSSYQGGYFTDLPGSRQDMTKMHGLLEFQLGFERVESLLNPTQDQLITSLKALLQEAGPEDLLVFYFSGHGITSQDEQILLLSKAEDLTEPFRQEAPSLQLLLKKSEKNGLKRLFILDCCRELIKTDLVDRSVVPIDLLERRIEWAQPKNVPLNAAQWAGVRDNHTGLVWEAKTTDGGFMIKSMSIAGVV